MSRIVLAAVTFSKDSHCPVTPKGGPLWLTVPKSGTERTEV